MNTTHLTPKQKEFLSLFDSGTHQVVSKWKRTVEALERKGFLVITLDSTIQFSVYVFTETERAILSQLMECTGVHFLDSGRSNGRMWQRNQAKGALGILNESASYLEVGVYDGKPELMITHNVFHWMKEKLEYSSSGQELLNCFLRETGTDAWCAGLLEEFVEWLRHAGHTVSGIYGDGEPIIDNTYNSSENCLSQDMVYLYITIESEKNYDNPYIIPEPYVFISIHNGADVRGGYTSIRAYTERDELSFFDYNRASISCELNDECVNWYADGYDFINDDGLENLNDFSCIELECVCVREPIIEYNEDWTERKIQNGKYKDRDIPDDLEHIYVYDGKGYYGGAELQSYFY